MSTLFALLALGANVAVVIALATSLVPAWRPLRTRLVDELRPSRLGLAAVVTAVATGGSLYYSEIAGFPPCNLCWVQRGFMYPLAAVLTVAGVVGTAASLRWLRWAAVTGATVSVWHLLVERFPAIEGAVACDPTNPCSLMWVRELGFVTIPYMALSAFVLTAVLLSITPTPAPAQTPSTQIRTSTRQDAR